MRRVKHYIIEMQVLNVAGFEKRILYSACKAYSGQLNSGDDYHLLTDVITITDFVMFPQTDNEAVEKPSSKNVL